MIHVLRPKRPRIDVAAVLFALTVATVVAVVLAGCSGCRSPVARSTEECRDDAVNVLALSAKIPTSAPAPPAPGRSVEQTRHEIERWKAGRQAEAALLEYIDAAAAEMEPTPPVIEPTPDPISTPQLPATSSSVCVNGRCGPPSGGCANGRCGTAQPRPRLLGRWLGR